MILIIPTRIMKWVDITYTCWYWKGVKTKTGYGKLNFLDKNHLAHRFIYELIKGKIRNGSSLHHSCKNHSCVNPNHLEVVTNEEKYQKKPTQKPKFVPYTNSIYLDIRSEQRHNETIRWTKISIIAGMIIGTIAIIFS